MRDYWTLFLSFFKIGCFTFGGGYAMIPIIQKEVILKRRWVDKDEFLNLLALAQSAPGPMAVNTSIMVGYKLHRVPGAIAAFLGTVLPSFVILLVIALFFTRISDNPVVVSVFKGIRPVVVALILQPVYNFLKEVTYWEYPLILAIAAAIFFGLSPIWFILGGIVAGIGMALYNLRKINRIH